MKTSRIILITVAGVIIAILITALYILKKDYKSLIESQALIEYENVPVEKFVSLEFSSHWNVSVRQGKECKVEVAVKEHGNVVPKLINEDGTLYFNTEALLDDTPDIIHARVTVPLLQEIKASGNTKIQMKHFWADSITIILDDSSKFYGKHNDFTEITFKAYVNDK